MSIIPSRPGRKKLHRICIPKPSERTVSSPTPPKVGDQGTRRTGEVNVVSVDVRVGTVRRNPGSTPRPHRVQRLSTVSPNNVVPDLNSDHKNSDWFTKVAGQEGEGGPSSRLFDLVGRD